LRFFGGQSRVIKIFEVFQRFDDIVEDATKASVSSAGYRP
jgi:hypothetical protein